MIFLLDYDRNSGRLVRFQEYAEIHREQASRDRLALEIELLSKGISREIVLLEAESEEDLRKTHNRYFRGIEDLAKSVKATVKFTDPAQGPEGRKEKEEKGSGSFIP